MSIVQEREEAAPSFAWLDEAEGHVPGETRGAAWEGAPLDQVPDPDEGVRAYVREIGRYALLDAAEEELLARRMERGRIEREKLPSYVPDWQVIDEGDEARRRLTEANLRLVVWVAKKYVGKRPPPGITTPPSDVVCALDAPHIPPTQRTDSFSVQAGERKVTYHLQLAACGKAQCRKCRERSGHGPYWFAYTTQGGKTARTYVGKRLPPTVQAPAPMQQAIDAARSLLPGGEPGGGEAAKPGANALPAGHPGSPVDCMSA